MANLLPAGTTVTVETKWFPPFTVDLSDQSGDPGRFVKLLKPKVTVRIAGAPLASAAPAGEPAPNEWGKVKIALAIIAALAVFSVLRIVK